MKRPQLNFLVDIAAFVAFLFLLSSGLLLRYQLPPGSGGLKGQGGGGSSRIVTALWGQTRHDWGDIHFWIAVALVAILALHLFLHWKWIVCALGGTRSEASGLRFGLGLAAAVALVALAVAPLIAPTEDMTREELESAGHIDASDWDALRGSMTLDEAAAEAGVSIDYLREELGLADDVAPDDRMGPSLRRVGKHMSDVHRLFSETADTNATSKSQEAKP